MKLKDLLITMSPSIRYLVVTLEADENKHRKEVFDNTIVSYNTLQDYEIFIKSLYGDYFVLSIRPIKEDHPFDDYLEILIFEGTF